MGRLSFLVLVPALWGACSSDTTAPLDLAVTSAPDMAPGPCSDEPAPGSVCPVEVTGMIAAETGLTTSDLVVSVCAGLCFYGSADASGAFSVVADQHIVLSQYACELHGRPSAFSYYAPLPAASGTSLSYAAPLPMLAVPATGPALPEDTSAATVTNGDVTLIIAAGTKTLFSVEDYGVPQGHSLRTRTIPNPADFPFTIGHSLAALYALTPFEAGFSQKVAVTVANSAQLPADAAVELVGMTGLLHDAPPAGQLVHVATAHVSGDGAVITTDTGEGLTELTWLGVVMP
jgi:hypothetical protein